MWIARDYNGSLRLHFDKPKRQGYVWHTDNYFGSPRSITIQAPLDGDPYPNLKWTDNPIQIEFKKK